MFRTLRNGTKQHNPRPRSFSHLIAATHPAHSPFHTTILIAEHAAVSSALIHMRWAEAGGMFSPRPQGNI